MFVCCMSILMSLCIKDLLVHVHVITCLLLQMCIFADICTESVHLSVSFVCFFSPYSIRFLRD